MERSAGILLAISSLPSKYGIGSFSKEAYRFVDWLRSAHQSYWQILPMGPTGYGDSPYQSFSTFAGNPYFIDLDTLVDQGLLTDRECREIDWGDDGRYVDYRTIYEGRYPILRKSYERWKMTDSMEFSMFMDENKEWIYDYSLFMAVKDSLGGIPWTEWPQDIRNRQPDAVQQMQIKLADEIHFQQYMQYLFYTQWNALKSYANKNHIRIIGDIPIYVAMDSADVWAHPELFRLDEDRRPYEVAGCPPDGFSETGQLWGNPIYDWELNRQTGYSWWIARMSHSYKLYVVVRIDHFRGFDEYYAIPYGEETAVNGKWKKGPGMDLFRNIEKALGKRDVIAEDLGFVTDSVRKLVHDSGFPGMKVVEFAFDVRDTGAASDYLPHNYIRNCVVYTGTHDNETLAGWYRELKKEDKKFALRYMGRKKLSVNEAVWEIIRLAQSSVADTCIIPIQDYLCLGNEARINHPSTLGGNWIWRLHRDEISKKLVKKIRRMTELYCRIPEKTEMLLKAEDAEDLGEEKK